MKKFILYPQDDLSDGPELLKLGILLLLHDETLGITQRALKALRDELAQRIEHELLVFQVPSGDDDTCRCYGFFLVDKTARELAIIGDGFRGDGGGEGGSGARAAQALLAIYDLKPIEMLPEEAIPYRDDASAYQEITEKVLELAEVEKFHIARENKPGYVDYLLGG